MNQTPNYQLSQWEASDRIQRTDFNADNQKIDAVLKAEANTRASAVSAINATLSGMVRLKVGHYTGDGAESLFISVGFTPKAVLTLTQYGRLTSYNPGGGDPIYGGLAVTGYVAGTANYPNVEIVSGGFKVHYLANYPICANKSGEEYNYIALG